MPDPMNYAYPGDPKLKLMTLGQMADYLLDMRGTGYMAALGKDGQKVKVGKSIITLEPVDLARLTQIVNALKYFEDKERARR